MKSTFNALNNAYKHTLDGNEDLRLSTYGRAAADGIPSCVNGLHKMTKGYMLLPMAEESPLNYFELLKQFKAKADGDEGYREEYKIALETLINFKDLFLRDVAINYFCEVSTCSWSSNYGRSLDNLYLYLSKNISEIVEGDCYGVAKYKPGYDLKKLERTLKTVEAYALNLLLMYVTHKSTHYAGKTYTASAYDFGDYAYVQVNSHDKYTHNAVARPRLHQVLKEAYYSDYLNELKKISSEIRISTANELKAEISRLVDAKSPKNADEKEYFQYAALVAKDDLSRRSFFNTFGKFAIGYKKLLKPILKTCLGAEEVGSFELDQPFTRKRWLGVCNMIAWANDWSVEMVRVITFLLGFTGIGLIAYIALYFAGKSNYYLNNFSVEKHD